MCVCGGGNPPLSDLAAPEHGWREEHTGLTMNSKVSLGERMSVEY